ncbi:hypothetical protein B0A52_06093 [Exophiala mesophila]|uniref:Transcription factor domain-containing protein n=1 Tax=Exophiala mesophila TaxID=212818 RepID=A0A438N5B9_EXOME|nr:hypothetical protein B0A52_06093 [Exophiala mesophila]
MDGGQLEEQYRQDIKRAVKQNFKLLRRGMATTTPSVPNSRSSARLSSQQVQEVIDPGAADHQSLQEVGLDLDDANTRGGGGPPPPLFWRSGDQQQESTGPMVITSSSSDHAAAAAAAAITTTITTTMNIPAAEEDAPESTAVSLCHQHSVPNKANQEAKGLDYQDAELLMHYFDHVFPLQFRFYQRAGRAVNRGWLLWLLVRTGPLYHAALSLSALHQFTLRYHGQSDKLDELNEYHSKAIRDLQSFLRANQDNNAASDHRSRSIEVLACGVSLISFELFRGGVSDWELHLNALASIVHDLDLDLHSTSPGVYPEFYRGTTPTSIDSAALPFLIAVVLWFDLLSCATTGSAPRLSYQELLQNGAINLEDVVGCENWVMTSIGDLAILNLWKKTARQNGMLNQQELLERSLIIEHKLEQGLAMIESQVVFEGPQQRKDRFRGQYTSASAPIVLIITRIFASAALVQLHTIVSGAFPSVLEIQHAVTRTMDALRHIEDDQDMRGLIWPVCLSGCMAQPHQQPFYRDLMRKVIGDSPQEFGNCVTVLQIMETCWESRLLHPAEEWNWERAMAEMHICGLLV